MTNKNFEIETKMQSDLSKKVYKFLSELPKGKVATYGQIAEFFGNKNLARVVGNILHKNCDKEKFPCFKVLSGKGNFSKNYAFGGLERRNKAQKKRELLS